MQLEMFDTIKLEPDYDVNSKTRLCPKCNIHKPKNMFCLVDLSYNGKGKKRTAKPAGNALYCKLCKKVYTDALSRLHKENTKPVDQIFCDCCNIKVKSKKFMLDHCHETNQFRGWVCRNCNSGIGNLGDNVEGLENAIRYLKRNKEHETRT
tara:strand:+ start:1082 stop:1534 length:453 start_codon:yes stop_codon:yes gene_type:complete